MDRATARALLSAMPVRAPRAVSLKDASWVMRLLNEPLTATPGDIPEPVVVLFDRGWVTVAATAPDESPTSLSAGPKTSSTVATITVSLDPDQAHAYAQHAQYLLSFEPYARQRHALDAAFTDQQHVTTLTPLLGYTDATIVRAERAPRAGNNENTRDTRPAWEPVAYTATGPLSWRQLLPDDVRNRWRDWQPLSPSLRRATRRALAPLVQRHGVGVGVDLFTRRVTPAAPLLPVAERAAADRTAVPLVLIDALAHLAPAVHPTTSTEFATWLTRTRKPPTVTMACETPSATGRTMHRITITIDSDGTSTLTLLHHEDRATTEVMTALTGTRNDCLTFARAVESTTADLRPVVGMFRAPNAAALRTVWLAYQYHQAGYALTDVAPLLHHGPNPTAAQPWLNAGVPVADIATWANHTIEDYFRRTSAPGATPTPADGPGSTGAPVSTSIDTLTAGK